MDILLIFVIASIFALIGLGLGFGLGTLRKSGSAQSDGAPPGLPKERVELLRVWRVERTGKMIALVEGKPVSPTHMTEEQKASLTQVVAGMQKLIGESEPAKPAPPPAAVPSPVERPPARPEPAPPAAADPLPEPQQAGAPPPDEPAVPGQPSTAYFADSLPEPVSLRKALTSNPFKISVPGVAPKPASAPKSIVEQIDEILQEKLAASSSTEEVKLQEIPNGMAVMIGFKRYESVDAVPDPTIRTLIKEAAREWNERASRRR